MPTTATRENTTVTYNANGGESAEISDSISYTFGGWYFENDFKNQVTSSTEVTSTINHTLYAKWTASKSLTSSTATSATYSAGGTYSANESATLYAVWKINSYTVSKNTVTGGSITVASSADYGSTVTFTTTASTNFTYYGATVVNSSGTTIATLSSSEKSFTMPASNVTIKPQWKYADLTLLSVGTKTSYDADDFVLGKTEAGGGSYSWSYLDETDKYFIQVYVKGLYRVDILTNSTFNLTHYATLGSRIVAISGQSTSNQAYVALGIVSNKSSWVYYGSATVAGTQQAVTDGNAVNLSVDITSYTGNYYLGTQCLGTSSWNGNCWIAGMTLYGRVYS